MLEKQTYFSRVPHSGGTSVSSAGLFFEQFGKMTLEHRVFIVIGLLRREIERESSSTFDTILGTTGGGVGEKTKKSPKRNNLTLCKLLSVQFSYIERIA